MFWSVELFSVVRVLIKIGVAFGSDFLTEGEIGVGVGIGDGAEETEEGVEDANLRWQCNTSYGTLYFSQLVRQTWQLFVSTPPGCASTKNGSKKTIAIKNLRMFLWLIIFRIHSFLQKIPQSLKIRTSFNIFPIS